MRALLEDEVMSRVRLNDRKVCPTPESVSNIMKWVYLCLWGRDRARDEEAQGLRQEAGQLRALLEEAAGEVQPLSHRMYL